MNQPGPICNPCTDRHQNGGHMLNRPTPAHVWGGFDPSPEGTGCQRCGGQIMPATLYVCSDDPERPGVAHVTCPDRVAPPIPAPVWRCIDCDATSEEHIAGERDGSIAHPWHPHLVDAGGTL